MLDRERRADGSHAVPAAKVVSRLASPRSRALALQRVAGNRAAARVLSRWAAHPDKDKKGALVADEAVETYNRLNPPLSQ